MHKILTLCLQIIKHLLIDLGMPKVCGVSTLNEKFLYSSWELASWKQKYLFHILLAHFFRKVINTQDYFFKLKSQGFVLIKILIEFHVHLVNFLCWERRSKHSQHWSFFLACENLTKERDKLFYLLYYSKKLHLCVFKFLFLEFSKVQHVDVHPCHYVIKEIPFA